MKIDKLYLFDDFVANVLNEDYAQRQNVIDIALKKIKQEYGESASEFMDNIQKKGGPDELERFIIKTIKPYVSPMKMTGDSHNDYETILRGLTEYYILTLELQKEKKTYKDKTGSLHK